MNENIPDKHDPVLLKNVLEIFKAENAHLNNSRFIDATLGLGGHAEALIKAGGEVLGIDADNVYLENVRERLTKACPTPNDIGGCFKLVQGNFKDIAKIAHKEGYDPVDGILFDLGVSTPQLTSPIRGFSFQSGGALLDMRLDPGSQAVTAADLLNVLDRRQLIEMFTQVLDYKTSGKLAAAIIKKRIGKPFKIVSDLNEVIARTVRPKVGLHPATLPFMTLRMAVNTELVNLQDALPNAFSLLKKGGRMVVISFHSGEDKAIKEFFREKVSTREAELLTKEIITPNEAEIKNNPRARSAKLRAIQKL